MLNAPDNITVSPRGGLVLCEDGSGEEFLHGLTVDGEIFQFAKNNVVLNGERNGITGNFSGSEFAGACYSPDGNWLFANIQSPGDHVRDYRALADRGPLSRALRFQNLAAAQLPIELQRLADDRDRLLGSKQVLDDDLLVLEGLVVHEEPAQLDSRWAGSCALSV